MKWTREPLTLEMIRPPIGSTIQVGNYDFRVDSERENDDGTVTQSLMRVGFEAPALVT
jgi:hypothetical protein